MKHEALLPLAVFCSGFGSNLEALVRAEKKGRLGARIVLVVCDRPGAYAMVRANRWGIPIFLAQMEAFPSRRAYERALVRVLRKKRIRLIALAGFMRILGSTFLKAFRNRILNIHPALLPSFKGAYAMQDAWEHGVRVTGVTVHFVTEELDNGPIILQEPVRVFPKDTFESFEKKIHQVEHRLYPEAVRLFTQGRLRIKGRRVMLGSKR